MTIAGLESAIDLAELAMEETHFGVLEDKVLKNYIATGRILVNAPTAVGALGGVYNSMPPTFSLGCGTWGGSNTTDNNYRNLLNIKAVSRRQSPPQWFRVNAFLGLNHALAHAVGARFSGLGIDRREFDDAVLDLAKTAFTDPSIRTNPRIPLLREIVELLHAGYGD